MQAFKSYRANIQKNKKATNKKTDRGENNIVRFSEKLAYKKQHIKKPTEVKTI